jgi:hypothetical protein
MSSRLTIESVLWLILVIGIAYLLWRMQHDKHIFESFENSNDVSDNIIKLYYDTLQRAPTSEELKKQTKDIFEKKYDYKELELRIVNSDEYQRLIKTQTTTILPETTRVLEEKELITRVKRVYLKIREKECVAEMYLPLKDLYIYFEYNVYKFVALLRDTKYADFENIVKNDPNLSRESLIELYLSMFDNSKLNYDAAAIEEMDKSLPEGTRLLDYLMSDDPLSPSEQNKVNAFGMVAYLMKNLKDEEERKRALEEKQRIKEMRDAANELNKQEKKLITAAVASTGKNTCTSTQRVYLPDESKILKTEHGFRVMQNLPPVCIPVGKKTDELSEVVLYSKLQGTSLDEAADTQIGSIMPKFEYRRYIEIGVPGTMSLSPAPR